MMRKLTVCACALVALLLLCSDARAQGCSPVYGGYGYAASYYYAPSYYAPSYGYAASYYAPSYYAPSYGYAPSYYAPSYGYAASYYAPSYGYAASYSGYGGYGYGGYGYGYNPGGLGGPYSGLGVRPGLGLGGFGLRR
jgi:hypothetical protein